MKLELPENAKLKAKTKEFISELEDKAGNMVSAFDEKADEVDLPVELPQIPLEIKADENIKQPLKKAVKKEAAKLAVVAVSAGILTAGSAAAIDANPISDGEIFNAMNSGSEVVMDIDELNAEVEEDTEEENEEKTRKRGFFGYLKLAFYGMIAGITAFFTVKIPWKKILTKRNLKIAIALVILFLIVRYVLPFFIDLPWGPDYFWLSGRS